MSAASRKSPDTSPAVAPSPPDGARRRVGMISLGCAKNRVDSEVMLGELAGRGYEIVADVESADTVIVNTCGFVEDARRESIDAILEVAAGKARSDAGQPGKRLLVAGCMVNKHGQELQREIPEIDGFISLDQLRDVDQIVQLGGGPPLPSPSHMVFDHTAPRLLTTHGYAYLKVAEGCNNPCTFCAIPVWRGRFRSRNVDSLVTEARELEQAGIQELCLIAQDTTRFGEDLDGWESKSARRHGLLRLVEALLASTSIPWIRFLYAYPTTLDRELLALMGREPRFCSYLDMPLQHSHPEMLSAMRRGGSAERYHRILAEARELVPDISLRTTFIVGFPGETEEHFEHLLRFVEAERFDHLGAFVYSPEEGTPGATLPGRVPKRVARRRYERLLAAQREIALERRQRFLGQRLQVLVEGVCEETEHLLQGRHQGMAPDIDGRLLINDGAATPGTFATVEITDAFADDLVGHVVEAETPPGEQPATSIAAASGR